MYCKNVSNYTIKMHVFDYLKYGSKFFYVWNHVTAAIRAVGLNVTPDFTKERINLICLPISLGVICWLLWVCIAFFGSTADQYQYVSRQQVMLLLL